MTTTLSSFAELVAPEIRKDIHRQLLQLRDADGRLPCHPYTKWIGAHWTLVSLADTGYPAGDTELLPLREQVLDWLFSVVHIKNIKTINGRVRRCASQEGNALYAMLKLGIADDRIEWLVDSLLRWQWDDGGWNCDKNPAAHCSSFHETITPLRSLIAYRQATGTNRVDDTIVRAAEVFLSRGMFRRKHDGSLIDGTHRTPQKRQSMFHRKHDGSGIKTIFLLLHYPPYYHYDVLFGLKVMAEGGFIGDARCKEALDWLESKRLAGGGFPLEAKYFRYIPELKWGKGWTSGVTQVQWGKVSRRTPNPFVTADAMFILNVAGRGN